MKRISKKLVIIGAPRSGTNMLRDVLTSLPDMATWPCDEINYIWRYGNVKYPSDEIPPDQLTPSIQRYIHKAFDWVALRYNAKTVVEKTCANSLRVDFVNHAVPDARYIFIRRNGLDAVGSAIKRWKAKLDIPYLARKARFVPAADMPYYAGRFLLNRLHRLVSSEKHLAFWGPRIDHMEQLLHKHSLEEVCALQWKRCVDSSAVSFSRMPKNQWIEIRYEDFVRKPESELSRILDFLGLTIGLQQKRQATLNVTPTSIGKGKASLGEEKIQRLTPIIHDTMDRYGYA
jgi:hypothetical protein